eukprot:TRINITY_DN123455_c0_g1_i1.p1 TRINITY_DN123455_c0_g1~~TRINITY_DN123455_c0_g1_i1.p1  ORF type:complete len:209 (-),score=42.06 TRINITY_DN123455_c0_g1_i1:96-722(-)
MAMSAERSIVGEERVASRRSGADADRQEHKIYEAGREQLLAPWSVLTASCDRDGNWLLPERVEDGQVKVQHVRDIMKNFEDQLTAQEVEWILGLEPDSKKTVKFEDVFELVGRGSSSEFDPVQDAFDMVAKDGVVDLEKFLGAFETLGVEGVTLPVLRQAVDEMLDDPKLRLEPQLRSQIDLETFRKLCSLTPQAQPQARKSRRSVGA